MPRKRLEVNMKITAARWLCAMALWAPFLQAASLTAQTADMVTDEPLIQTARTTHSLSLGQRPSSYAAMFEEFPLYDAQGKMQASICATSYVLDKVREPAARPVMFLFNGGPGASSSPLHFSAFGPKHYQAGANDARVLADNPNTLLDAADLVFIDPVGTGFSRERAGGVSGLYFSPQADADSVLTVIRQWLKGHHREKSPLFIAGESYGGFRLALMMQHAEDLPLAGLILISPLLDPSGTAAALGNDQSFIFDLPAFAVAAWEHHKAGRTQPDAASVYAEAVAYAQTEYALALQQGSALDPATRDKVAERVSALIGLPREAVQKANLRVDSEDFLGALLADQSREVGRLDTRVTAPKAPPANPDRPAAANDPALGLGASNVIKSQTIKTYLLKDLNVKTERDYLSLTLDVNFRFKWSELFEHQANGDQPFYFNSTPYIAAVMKKQPALRLLVVGGYYDLAVPLLAPRYAIVHAGVPPERVSFVALAAGHSVFGDDRLQQDGAALVRRFLRGESP
jgi:carboxypeptidase C (cathepsin A)